MSVLRLYHRKGEVSWSHLRLSPGKEIASFLQSQQSQILPCLFSDTALCMMVFGTGLWFSLPSLGVIPVLPISFFLFLFCLGQEATAIER